MTKIVFKRDRLNLNLLKGKQVRPLSYEELLNRDYYRVGLHLFLNKIKDKFLIGMKHQYD